MSGRTSFFPRRFSLSINETSTTIRLDALLADYIMRFHSNDAITIYLLTDALSAALRSASTTPRSTPAQMNSP